MAKDKSTTTTTAQEARMTTAQSALPSGVVPEDFDLTTLKTGDTFIVRKFVLTGELQSPLKDNVDGYREGARLALGMVGTVTGPYSVRNKFLQAQSASGYTVRIVREDSIVVLTRVTPLASTSEPMPAQHYALMAKFITAAAENGQAERRQEAAYTMQAMAELRAKDVPAAQRLLGQSSQSNRNAQAWEIVAEEMDALLAQFTTERGEEPIELPSLLGSSLDAELVMQAQAPGTTARRRTAGAR